METTKIKSFFQSSFILILGIAFIKLLIHLYTSGNYDYGWGELFHLDLASHLDWGYVQFQPLTVIMTKIGLIIFGKSTLGIRIMPALAGTATVIITGLLAQELGGKRFAQGLAALTVLIAPIILLSSTMLDTTAYEPFIWTGCAYALVLAINRQNWKYLLLFGFLLGLGFENKYNMFFWFFALSLGLLFTQERKIFKNSLFWIACSISILLILPNLIWQVNHKFPAIEFIIYRLTDNDVIHLNLYKYLLDQLIMLNPVTLPLIFAGLYFYLKNKSFRFLGLAYLIILALVFSLKGNKVYYIAPVYPVLFASGAVMLETWFLRTKHSLSLKIIFITILLFFAVIEAPLWIPLLSPENYIAYSQKIKLSPPPIWNFKQEGMPQILSGFFGMSKMTKTVSEFYNQLPQEEKAKTTIFTSNYGETAAINFLGQSYGLPRAISNTVDYYYFGPPNYYVENIIFVGGFVQPVFKQNCASFDKVREANLEYAPAFLNQPLYYCKELKIPLNIIWPSIKNLGAFTG